MTFFNFVMANIFTIAQVLSHDYLCSEICKECPLTKLCKYVWSVVSIPLFTVVFMLFNFGWGTYSVLPLCCASKPPSLWCARIISVKIQFQTSRVHSAVWTVHARVYILAVHIVFPAGPISNIGCLIHFLINYWVIQFPYLIWYCQINQFRYNTEIGEFRFECTIGQRIQIRIITLNLEYWCSHVVDHEKWLAVTFSLHFYS
jgi:hypothetical protein